MTETPVTELREQIEQMEQSYEFLISFAGRGVGREGAQSATDQIREHVGGFEEALEVGYDAALDIPDDHDEFDTDAYAGFVEAMADEVEEARTVLSLVGEQDRITSQQVDNMNGMSVFQSVIMKFFFLDELTYHLERPDTHPAAADADDDE